MERQPSTARTPGWGPGEEPGRAPRVPGPWRLPCQYCAATFEDASDLLAHERRGHAPSPGTPPSAFEPGRPEGEAGTTMAERTEERGTGAERSITPGREPLDEEMLPTGGEPVRQEDVGGDRPDTAGRLGPMAPEAARSLEEGREERIRRSVEAGMERGETRRAAEREAGMWDRFRRWLGG